MQKTYKWYSKSVYGNTLNYFADQNDARYWYNISGKRTISRFEMNQLTALTGISFERVFEPEPAYA